MSLSLFLSPPSTSFINRPPIIFTLHTLFRTQNSCVLQFFPHWLSIPQAITLSSHTASNKHSDALIITPHHCLSLLTSLLLSPSFPPFFLTSLVLTLSSLYIFYLRMPIFHSLVNFASVAKRKIHKSNKSCGNLSSRF